MKSQGQEQEVFKAQELGTKVSSSTLQNLRPSEVLFFLCEYGSFRGK